MERVAWDLARRWATSGHRVSCVTTPLPGARAGNPHRPQLVDGVWVHHVEGRPGSYAGRWRRRAAGFTATQEWDVVLSVSSAAHALVRSGARGRPVVMQAHGTAWAEVTSALRSGTWQAPLRAARSARGLGIDAAAYRRYSAVVAVGDGIAGELRRWPRPVAPRHVVLIRNGIPTITVEGDLQAVRASLDVAPDDRLAVFAGRLVHDKGPDLALEAARSAGWQLRVFGEGPLTAQLSARLRQCGEDPRRVLRGWVLSDELRRALAAADLAVLPSRRVEGLSIVALEAIAAGTSLLAAEHNRPSLTPLGAAVIFADGDASSLADAMRSYQGARRGVVLPPEYDADAVADRYVELFDRLRGGGRGRS
jgi:glycosyltransferase involved in cell wall biosynthesis